MWPGVCSPEVSKMTPIGPFEHEIMPLVARVSTTKSRDELDYVLLLQTIHLLQNVHFFSPSVVCRDTISGLSMHFLHRDELRPWFTLSFVSKSRSYNTRANLFERGFAHRIS